MFIFVILFYNKGGIKLETLIKNLESIEFEGYYSYESFIKSQENSEENNYEQLAFQFVTNSDSYDYGIESYFKPYYQFGDEIYPSVEAITPEALIYWGKRSNESKNPYLIARYSDLVWNFNKLYPGTIEKPFIYAIRAIENYIQFSLSDSTKKRSQFDIKHGIIRALKLAETLNQKDKFEDIYKKMIEIENLIEDESIGLWGFCFDEMLEKSTGVPIKIENEIISKIEQRIERLLNLNDKETNKYNAIEYAVSKLTKYFHKKGIVDKVHPLLDIIEKVIDETEEPHIKEFRYNKLLELYDAVQLHQSDNRIIRKMSNAAEKAKNNLKEASFSTQIKREELETFINSYYTGNLTNDLRVVAVRFIPNIEDNLRMIDDQRSKGIGLLSELVTHVKINKDGMAITTMDLSNENDRLANHLEITIGVQMSFFNDIMMKFEKEYNLDAEKLGRALMQSPILIEENHGILLSALQNYFNEDYLAFIHIMIPYIEATLRNLIKLTGDSIYKLNKSGTGYDAILLGDILSKEYLEEIMPKDLVYYYKYLYNDKKGFNLRNIIAHGVAHPQLFNKENANKIMHTLFTFLLFEFHKQE